MSGIDIHLLGHGPKLHASEPELLSGHSVPPCWASCAFVLILLFVPSPQVSLQVSQSPHSAHSQSTIKIHKTIVITLNNYIKRYISRKSIYQNEFPITWTINHPITILSLCCIPSTCISSIFFFLYFGSSSSLSSRISARGAAFCPTFRPVIPYTMF